MSTVWRKTTQFFLPRQAVPAILPPRFSVSRFRTRELRYDDSSLRAFPHRKICRGYKTARRVKNTGMEYLPLSFEVTQPFREETSLADALPSDVTQTDADAPSSPSVDTIVLMNDLVTYVRSFECDGIVVAAILTQPIYLASERKKLKDDLTDKLTSALGKPAVVTFDMEVFRKIKGNLSDDDKRRLLKTALKNGVL